MIDPAHFVTLLNEEGVSLFTGVPDSLLKAFGQHVEATLPSEHHVIAANEGAAVGIALGHHLRTGEPALVYLQNSGFGNTINPLLSLADPEVYGVPMVLLIGWRGQPGVKDEPQHVKQGRVLPAMLDAIEMPWWVLPSEPEQADVVVRDAVARARTDSSPVAILVEKGTFAAATAAAPAPSDAADDGFASREAALEALVDQVPDDALVIATTGMLSRELFELRRAAGTTGDRDFLTVGGMGHASSIALGVAKREAAREVWCFDGDGALLMHLGSLPVIASNAPTNLRHVVFNNGVHDSVGGQPTAIDVVDISAAARALGYRAAARVDDLDRLPTTLEELHREPGPTLLELRVRPGSRPDLGRPTRTPAESKHAFMGAVS